MAQKRHKNGQKAELHRQFWAIFGPILAVQLATKKWPENGSKMAQKRGLCNSAFIWRLQRCTHLWWKPNGIYVIIYIKLFSYIYVMQYKCDHKIQAVTQIKMEKQLAVCNKKEGKMLPKSLVVFDFDHTLLNVNSDIEIQKLLPGT